MNIDQHILEIIERGETEGDLYFLPEGQLDRKVYLEVNKVLECLGGKWNWKLKGHVFGYTVSDAIDNVLLTGEVTDPKKEFQFFETPRNIVDQLIELAEIRPGHLCLEPSAGTGNIAEAMREIAGDGRVTCVELNPENAKVLADKKFTTHQCDFLQYVVGVAIDRIVMNPPFTKQQDIDHVLKAMLHLVEGGILVSVMSLGVEFRQNKKTVAFWNKIKEYEFEVIKLPGDAFKESDTMVNTIILKVTSVKE